MPKAKATVARNQNSIRLQNREKNNLGETRLSQGPVLHWPTKEQCVIRHSTMSSDHCIVFRRWVVMKGKEYVVY